MFLHLAALGIDMKKAQVVKFWQALRENTSVKETISAFTNKKGYDSRATLDRFVRADTCFGQGLSSEAIAEKTGWSPKFVNKIRGWWEGEFSSQPAKPLVSDNDIRRHRSDLVEVVIPELKGINVFPARDLDLAIFWSRPSEPSWPIGSGKLERQTRGRLGIRLFIEEKLEWAYLRQHMKDDPVWDAVDAWKQAMVMDLTARFGLLDKIVAETQSRIGLPVLDDLVDLGNDKDALGLYYAYTLYDQVFSRAVGITLSSKRREDFTFEPPNVTRLGGYMVVRSHDLSLRTLAISYLLDAQVSLVELTETQAARAAYEAVLSITDSVKNHSERIRLAVAFPEGSTCDGCGQWVAASE